MSKITKEHLEGLKAEDFKEVDTRLHVLLHEAGLYNRPPIITAHIVNLLKVTKQYTELELNAFGNYLIKNSIQLKSSNHVAETVTKFLKERK